MYIDYENIPATLVRLGISQLIDWLEDGQFDERGQKRRIVGRKIYWNSAQAHLHQEFSDLGFETVLCEKHSGLKNGADIKLALDVIENALGSRSADEYIIVSSDSDFVPLLQKLKEHGKQSVMVVDEKRPTVHTSFSYHADTIVTHREFKQGLEYVRRRSFWFGWIEMDKVKPKSVEPKKTTGTPATASGDPVAEAERRVIQLISQRPLEVTSHRKIKEALRKIQGMHMMPIKGKSTPLWLSYNSYAGLMNELSKRSKKIHLKKGKHDSPSAVYIPDDPAT